jgi:ubiquinone biosynthesis protein UbiJ|tara:strand:- start:11685 stop:12320 length:636 start_codon:yes stop_codon:yes gene_type:complete
MLNQLPNNLLAFAEINGNRLLSLDDHVMSQCQTLQGNCIELHLTDLDFKLYCHPGSWGMRFSQEKPAGEIDAIISGRLMALVNLSLQEDKISTSIQERVSIQGDARVAQKMQKILTELDIDWEEALSKYTGDVMAYQIHKQVLGASEWLRNSARSLLQNTSEYIREEQLLSPTQVEFERFQKQTTILKQDVERSEARLRHLLKAASDNKTA